MWLCGPDFLRNEELLFDDEATDSLSKQTDPEVRKAQSFACADATLVNPVLICLESVSDWHRAKRVIAIWMIFGERLRKAVSQQTSPAANSLHVDVAFLRNAELEIVKQVQAECFREEINILRGYNVNSSNGDRTKELRRKKFLNRASRLYRLDPFKDDDGVIRVGGRIRRATNDSSFNHRDTLTKAPYHCTDNSPLS